MGTIRVVRPGGNSTVEVALLRIIAFKFLQAVPVILIISVLAFLLLSLLPGDPALVIAGEQASPEAIERVRQQLGLDRSFLQQLAIWLLNLVQGNFGSSLILNQSVVSAVGERLPVTLSLAALSISITIPVGVFLGSVAAYFRHSWIDALVMTLALLGCPFRLSGLRFSASSYSASVSAGCRRVVTRRYRRG